MVKRLALRHDKRMQLSVLVTLFFIETSLCVVTCCRPPVTPGRAGAIIRRLQICSGKQNVSKSFEAHGAGCIQSGTQIDQIRASTRKVRRSVLTDL